MNKYLVKSLKIISTAAILYQSIKILEQSHIVARFLQYKVKAENYRRASYSESTLENKYNLRSNIKYDSEFPRGFFDILTVKGEDYKNKPTYVYIHGGGFIAGDKISGDPASDNGHDRMWDNFKRMLDAGYNVVTLNYALAPDYKHPTQIQQVSKAFQLMADYSLNNKHYIISGASAGGALATEFVTIQSNPEYSELVGVKPVIKPNTVKALLLDVPLLDPYRANKTQNTKIINNIMFGCSVKAYYYPNVVREYNSKLDLIQFVNQSLPPVFITDGNVGSFKDQAIEYYDTLQAHHITSEIYIPDKMLGEQNHGYLGDLHSEATKIYKNKKFEFLRNLNLIK